jgi:hypothetical protein
MQDDSKYSRSLFSPHIVLPSLAIGLLLGWVSVAMDKTFAQSPKKSHQSGKRPRGRVLLETFPVAPSSKLRYQLSIAPCAQSTCQIEVRLIEGNMAYETLPLDWSSTPAQPVKTAIDESLGAGDPLQKKWQGKAWEIGTEEGNVSITARVIPLTKQLNGLLVDQRAGFEHLKRSHYLFVANGRNLVRAWTGSEGEGPTWSNVEISEPLSDGSQAFIYINGFRYPAENGAEDVADSLELAIYRWNERKNLLENVPVTDSSFSIVALIAGTYETVAEARKAITQNSDCLKNFLVLGADSLPRAFKGNFAIAALSTKAALAEQLMEGCAPGVKIERVNFSSLR